MRIFTKIASAAGLDRAVATTLIGRLWTLASGVGTIYFILRYLSAVEQGYYQTFSSLLAIQLLFEFGLSYSVVQFTSREATRLVIARDGSVRGDPISLNRLRSFMDQAVRRSSITACIFFVCASILGAVLFTSTQNSSDKTSWAVAWVLAVAFTSLRIVLLLVESVLEGLGHVSEVAQVRLVSVIVNSTVLWVALILGLNLYALPLALAALLITSISGHALRYWRIGRTLLSSVTDGMAVVNWRTEIWPFQWKIGISAFAGYFIFQIFTPATFYFRGAVEAGKLGVAFSIANAVNAVCSSWVNTQFPRIAALTAAGERTKLQSLFGLMTLRASGVGIASSLALMAALFLAGHFRAGFVQRLPTPEILFLLLIATVVNQYIFVTAAFARAEHKEPFMIPTIVMSLLTVAILAPFLIYLGPLGAAITYLLPVLVIGIPTAMKISQRLWAATPA
ncbi:MAG: hypothetical protein NVS9B10_05260 [Nevskia sp.]